MRTLPTIAILAVMFLFSVIPALAQPTLQLSTPQEGWVMTGDTVTVTFQVAEIQLVKSPVPLEEAGKRPETNRDGEGHLHLMLDLQPLVVWEQGDPYTFTSVPTGEHLLMVELVNNDHSPLSPPVIQQVRFQTVAGSILPNTGTLDDERPNGGTPAALLTVCGIAALALAIGLPRLRHRIRNSARTLR
jgi:hypothetical protein